MNGGCPSGRLVQLLLSLALSRGHCRLSLPGRIGDHLLGFGGRALAGVLGFFLGAGQRAVSLLLSRAEHALGLLLGLGPVLVGLGLGVGAELVRIGLGVGAELGDVVVSLGALRLRLVIGELEDLADPLADLLVRWLVSGARFGDVCLQPLGLLDCLGQPVLELAAAVVLGQQIETQLSDNLIHLHPVIAAPFQAKLAFISQVGEVALLAHRFTHQIGPGQSRRTGMRRGGRAVAGTAVILRLCRARRAD